MDVKDIEKIKKSFTDEQRAIYDVMLGDMGKLKSEWMLCRHMYDMAVKVVNAKETGPEPRGLLKIASTDYWSRRRLALERMLELLGLNEHLSAWRKEAENAKG
jgi:hypothetical protein